MTEKILDSGGQTENCRSLSPLLEALFLAFLTPCPSVSLFDHVVATHCGDHLLVVDGDHDSGVPGRPPHSCGAGRYEWPVGDRIHSRARSGTNSRPWYRGGAGGCRARNRARPLHAQCRMPLTLVHISSSCPAKRMVNSIHHSRRVTWLASRAALQQQFLNISTAKREVIHPNRVLDDHHRKPVAVRLRDRRGLAWPALVKATPPVQ